MTYSDPPASGPVYAYPLVSWGSVWAGVAVAIGLGLLFNSLGVAIGASAFSPYDLGHAQGRAFTIGGDLWVAFANLVGLQIGGFVAARSSRFPDHMKGMMQGLAVWAVATIIAMILAGSLLSSGLAGAADAAASHSGSISRAADQQVAATADAAKAATAAFAWWAFATMALGLVGAVAGGRLGSAHPAWPDRPRHVHAASL